MYFKHIKYHCLIPTGSTNAPTDEDWSCHGDNGGGNVGYGDSHCHGSSFAGPSNSNGDTSLTDQAKGLGGLTDSSISSERFGSVDRFSIDDPLGPSRRSEPHFPRGSRQPNNLQPPQNLGSSRADPSTKRKRSAKQNTIQQERRQLA
ncbi:hypothetical protein PDIDSM_1428 [Penicillium digitatum]|nr:hypothetical protein PDIDSM_1428 [Penicillium digitatum]